MILMNKAINSKIKRKTKIINKFKTSMIKPIEI